MKSRSLIEWLVIAIAVITVISAVSQIVSPKLVLGIMGAEATPTSLHLFATIGMFMLVIGGMLLQGILSSTKQPIVMLWSGLEKAGAVGGVCLGVAHHIYSPFALAIASFDLVSVIVIFYYWNSIRTSA